MAQAYEVYLDASDNHSLVFDQKLELQTLSQPGPEMTSTDVHINSEAETMAQSVGQGLNVDKFVDRYIADKSKHAALKNLLGYLVYSIDSATLRFTPDGQVFFQGSCVPEAHLATILQSLVNKKQKQIATGEYCLLLCLRDAPDSIKKMILPSKLKMCNIFLKEPAPPKNYPVKAPKVLQDQGGGGGPLRSTGKVRLVGPAPYPQVNPARQVQKNPPLDRSRQAVSKMKKQLNVYPAEIKKPWYTLN